ncbi:MAG: hypothetical protein IJ760_07050 [Bacteroidales bacterium]|nr:hypothetical protein [Bacteroidales bacterium]
MLTLSVILGIIAAGAISALLIIFWKQIAQAVLQFVKKGCEGLLEYEWDPDTGRLICLVYNSVNGLLRKVHDMIMIETKEDLEAQMREGLFSEEELEDLVAHRKVQRTVYNDVDA